MDGDFVLYVNGYVEYDFDVVLVYVLCVGRDEGIVIKFEDKCVCSFGFRFEFGGGRFVGLVMVFGFRNCFEMNKLDVLEYDVFIKIMFLDILIKDFWLNGVEILELF